MTSRSQTVITYLRTPHAVRERCYQLFNLACENRLQHFRCDLSRLGAVADYVIEVTRRQYPSLQIPWHSRWRHFEAGGIPRLQHLNQGLVELSSLEQTRARLDLVVVSVLLDAGSGGDWCYRETATNQVYRRSEGLAVASLEMFMRGMFSSDPDQPLRVDAPALQSLRLEHLIQGFQVSLSNPLVGLEGRLQLLQRLGEALSRAPQWFGSEPPRPGYLADYFLDFTPSLSASTFLGVILESMGSIWPGRIAIENVNLGDVWPHPALFKENLYDQVGIELVPFHKLSQWLVYSMLEPLEALPLQITDLDSLTGLAEYRNGGLCLDLGLLQVKDTSLLTQSFPPGHEVVVEWRALTLCLLDLIAEEMRRKLRLSASELPLGKVLQGGTWTAGRQIAAELRPDAAPPIRVESDGTVF
ncbi:MAG: URC4/urg3 family protein [Synechococcaceae cyanobacterium SM2_3_1]|nr:URC4/urg3 family protein [Synechococcaceae cyanobacterium SM2_3_1]